MLINHTQISISALQGSNLPKSLFIRHHQSKGKQRFCVLFFFFKTGLLFLKRLWHLGCTGCPEKVRRAGCGCQDLATMQLQKPVALSHFSRAALAIVQHWLDGPLPSLCSTLPIMGKSKFPHYCDHITILGNIFSHIMGCKNIRNRVTIAGQFFCCRQLVFSGKHQANQSSLKVPRTLKSTVEDETPYSRPPGRSRIIYWSQIILLLHHP